MVKAYLLKEWMDFLVYSGTDLIDGCKDGLFEDLIIDP